MGRSCLYKEEEESEDDYSRRKGWKGDNSTERKERGKFEDDYSRREGWEGDVSIRRKE